MVMGINWHFRNLTPIDNERALYILLTHFHDHEFQGVSIIINSGINWYAASELTRMQT